MLVASTSGADKILDGCPIIPLVDSPHDLAHLLRVLLPTSPTQPPQHSYFEDFSAVIRLPDKYHIQSTQDQALRALQEYHFTSDFATFCGPSDTAIVVEPIHTIGAVNLARLTDTPRMLPLALYKCCCLDDETLRAGWKHVDGTVEHLAPTDLERCSAARALLVALYASLYMQVLNVMPPDSGDGSTLGCMWFSGFVSSKLLHTLLTKRVGYNMFPDGAKVLERLLAGMRQPC